MLKCRAPRVAMVLSPPMVPPLAGNRGREDLGLFFVCQRPSRFFALAALLPLRRARARPQPPSVLEELKLVTADDSRAAFMLRFSPDEPQFAAVNTNPRRPELLMRATRPRAAACRSAAR